MAQKTYAGVTVDVTDEGYFTNPSQWTKEIAMEIAKEEGVDSSILHPHAQIPGQTSNAGPIGQAEDEEGNQDA